MCTPDLPGTIVEEWFHLQCARLTSREPLWKRNRTTALEKSNLNLVIISDALGIPWELMIHSLQSYNEQRDYHIIKTYSFCPANLQDYDCKYVSKFLLNKSHITEYGIYCSNLK